MITGETPSSQADGFVMTRCRSAYVKHDLGLHPSMLGCCTDGVGEIAVELYEYADVPLISGSR